MSTGRIGIGGRWRRAAAFSLLELVVTLLVMAVLLSLAIPGYRDHLARAHRAEGARILLAVAACQERLRADSGWYRTDRCLPESPPDSYRFRIEPRLETFSLSFVAVAEPAAGHARDRCGVLRLDHTGRRESTGEGVSSAECWGGR